MDRVRALAVLAAGLLGKAGKREWMSVGCAGKKEMNMSKISKHGIPRYNVVFTNLTKHIGRHSCMARLCLSTNLTFTDINQS
jgi:hypothetical protein